MNYHYGTKMLWKHFFCHVAFQPRYRSCLQMPAKFLLVTWLVRYASSNDCSLCQNKIKVMLNCVINSNSTASFSKKKTGAHSLVFFFATVEIRKYFVPLASNCLIKFKKKKLFDCNLLRQIVCLVKRLRVFIWGGLIYRHNSGLHATNVSINFFLFPSLFLFICTFVAFV